MNWQSSINQFKGAWSDFSEWSFKNSNDASSPKKTWYKISVKSVKLFEMPGDNV